MFQLVFLFYNGCDQWSYIYGFEFFQPFGQLAYKCGVVQLVSFRSTYVNHEAKMLNSIIFQWHIKICKTSKIPKSGLLYANCPMSVFLYLSYICFFSLFGFLIYLFIQFLNLRYSWSGRVSSFLKIVCYLKTLRPREISGDMLFYLKLF